MRRWQLPEDLGRSPWAERTAHVTRNHNSRPLQRNIEEQTRGADGETAGERTAPQVKRGCVRFTPTGQKLPRG